MQPGRVLSWRVWFPLAAGVLPALALPALAQVRPHAGMMRYPDVSKTHIVFAYANDLWLVPREGGPAAPLASPPGQEAFPRFSPDGQTIAFVGNYDGNRDLYTLPTSGGVPTRVTHHPTGEVLCDWTPDGRLIFFAGGLGSHPRVTQLFTVAATGGLPEQMPVPYGAFGAVSPDGEYLAYTPHTRDQSTWKRYMGGMATDIWLFHLTKHTSRQITDWAGTDTQPMWHGKKIFYLSDAGPEHRLNIWMYDTQNGNRGQLTRFKDFDVKFPAIGPGPKDKGEIVFQNGSDLHLLDLTTGKSKVVEIVIPGDRPKLRPQSTDVAGVIVAMDVSPTGKRAVFEARGDIWTVPAKKGSPRNLTRTSGVAERDPSWSPDKKWIAYFSDATGEYELYITQSDGKGETQQLTKDGNAYRYNPVWSPDSKYIVFQDKTGAIYLHTLPAVAEPEQPADAEPSRDPESSRDLEPSRDREEAESGEAEPSRDPELSRDREGAESGEAEPSRDPELSRDREGADSPQSASSPEREQATTTVEAGPEKKPGPEPGTTILIDCDPWANIARVTWSHDSNWFAYAKTGDNRQPAIWLYHVSAGEKHQVTSSLFNDTWPTFDRAGKYLFFASNRRFDSPLYADVDTTFIYTNTDVLLVVPLKADTASPWAPKSDEEDWKEAKKDEEKKDSEGKQDEDKPDQSSPTEPRPSESGFPGASELADKGRTQEKETPPGEEAAQAEGKEKEEKKADKEKKEEPKPVEIDLEGFERRAVPLPVEPGAFYSLAVNDSSKLLYVRAAAPGSKGEPSIKIFDLEDEEKKEKTVLDGTGSFVLSADGKRILVRKDNTFAIVDAAAEQKLDKPMSLAGMTAVIDPREEWRQVFTDTWRIQRDFFYDPGMHGVDWKAMYEHYGQMLADCVSREDVSYVIGEMIAELNIGHAYYWGGGTDEGPSVSVGLLGCDFELHEGAYRLKKIYEGAVWDHDARGPLSLPGVNVKEGEYLLAVNHVPVDTAKSPWAAFVGLAGRTVTITVSAKPTRDESARDVVVELLDNDENLRYRAWIEANRKYVEEKTGGKVGYIYVPDTGINGQNNLFRQFFGQVDKPALIVDERWNRGGQIPTRFIELLNRPITNYWARRDGRDWPWPPDSHQGPQCMLINGLSGSGGDAFPAYFRQAGLGKLIGRRTWGGLVGISGNPGLIDGGYTAVPTFGFYETDGTWGIEGHGVDPDIDVIDDPAKMVDGGDPQLDAAITHILGESERNPYKPPEKPAYPNRSGMGIRAEDK